MAATLEAAAEPVTLVPTGPLTNVAQLLTARPDLHGRIREIVLMGGSTGRGNTTPAAEFNIFVDPEAAAIVFESGLPLTMIGLNLTHQARATPEVLERIRALPGEPARAVEGWMAFFGAATSASTASSPRPCTTLHGRAADRPEPDPLRRQLRRGRDRGPLDARRHRRRPQRPARPAAQRARGDGARRAALLGPRHRRARAPRRRRPLNETLSRSASLRRGGAPRRDPRACRRGSA